MNMNYRYDVTGARTRLFWGRAVKPEQVNSVEVMDELERALDEIERMRRAVEALLPTRREPEYDADGHFLGFKDGPEHRTVGEHRAWSYDASEWCYPSSPCSGCEPWVTPFDLREVLES